MFGKFSNEEHKNANEEEKKVLPEKCERQQRKHFMLIFEKKVTWKTVNNLTNVTTELISNKKGVNATNEYKKRNENVNAKQRMPASNTNKFKETK